MTDYLRQGSGTAHAAPGAWAEGTAVKYRQTLTAIDRELAASDPVAAADVALLGMPGPPRWRPRSPPRRRARPSDPGPAPVHAAVGDRLVDLGRVGDRRSDRRVG